MSSVKQYKNHLEFPLRSPEHTQWPAWTPPPPPLCHPPRTSGTRCMWMRMEWRQHSWTGGRYALTWWYLMPLPDPACPSQRRQECPATPKQYHSHNIAPPPLPPLQLLSQLLSPYLPQRNVLSPLPENKRTRSITASPVSVSLASPVSMVDESE